MEDDTKIVAEHEQKTWNAIYQKQINNPQEGEFSSFWWEHYYRQLRQSVLDLLTLQDKKTTDIRVLEVGSGTGKASLFSVPKSELTLLDLAEKGFVLADKLSTMYGAKRVTCVKGNMFSLPFSDERYDLVWNIGTLEHYKSEHIKLILSEMFRVANFGGIVAIAIPNHNSLPMLKARLLGSDFWGKYLNWIPGYRADSEKNYSSNDLFYLFDEVAKESGFELKNKTTSYVGSPNFVESGKFGVNVFKPIELLLPKTKFLIMVSAVKTKE
jgi:ubiquinone/menaquinone biosynthesis C-methylase UbiE